MKRKKRLLATFVFMFLLVSFWVMAGEAGNNPVAVSPGSETEAVTVWQSCPTFSWSAVDQAASYRVAVFETVDANVTTYEDMAAMTSPVISKDIPGPALSWTLSSEERLKTGGQYSWYVRALDAYGNALGSWSGGRIFKVEQEVRFAGIEEKLEEILKSYGVNEETITNVLKDMKSEVQEVVVRGAEGAGVIKAPGRSGVLGYEGPYCTYFGMDAGVSNYASYNTFVGSFAGYTNTYGIGNSFLGYQAGYLNSTGNENIFLGNSAGYSNTTGNHNIFLGNSAGYSNTGSENVFLGYYAGKSNTTGAYNTFLGNGAGFSNTEAGDNVFIGTNAGYYNKNGFGNAFLGKNAGFANSSGSSNTFLGFNAGYSNNYGCDNVFLGYNAGRLNTSGNFNTFLGDLAGYSNDWGSSNTFLGYNAGYSNTEGMNNIFLGNGAGFTNTKGCFNVFLGYCAGRSNITGDYNAFLGYYAGFANTIGKDNTFLGYDAGRHNIDGSNNIFLGNKAGYSNTTGSQNIFLGYQAGYYETGSNKLYIANSAADFPLIYGEFDNRIVAVNGKLGIGTKTPLGTFEIETTGSNAVFIFERTNGAQGKFTARPGEVYIGTGSNHNVQIVANNNPIMTLTPSGYVGIGTNTPSYPLHMASGARCTVGGTWTNASSRSLKENIRSLSTGEAVEALKQLNPVKYNYKADKTERHVGFIAEDVPDLVASTDRKGLSPMDVTAVLTKVVQDLQRENQEYQKIISDLQERMAKLEKK